MELVNRLSPEHRLLLRASFSKGKSALRAWGEWAARVPFADLDYASQGLIPLLYQNLSRHGVTEPQLANYKGLYRKNWVKGQLLFRHAHKALSALQNEGIQPLLFNSAGLILGCQLSYALRPTNEVDFLVTESESLRAIDIVRNLGWPKPSPAQPSLHHFALPDGGVIKIHPHSLCWDPLIQAQNFQSGALRIDFDGLSVQIMSLVDQLIHFCTQGLWIRQNPALRWVADSALLLENSRLPMDWNFLVEQSQRLRTSLLVSDCLNYLKTELEIQIHENTLDILARLPTPWFEKWHYQLVTNPRVPFGRQIARRLLASARAAGYPSRH